MPDFWPDCGYSLLQKNADGRLRVTDDYLRMYYRRPELLPPEEADAAERALHASLLESPRREVTEAQIKALGDADAQENYRVMMRFRQRLIEAPTLEAFYFGLFQRDVAVPPDFIHHTVQVILRGLLDGSTDGFEVRAAELFFREQRITIQEGAVMAADSETVRTHAQTGGFGAIGRLLKENQMLTPSVELEVLDASSAPEYLERGGPYDAALQINPGQPGSLALCRVIERWLAHFHGVHSTVTTVREIPDEDWLWHVGLDAEATALLNEAYKGTAVEEERMKRVLGLFRVDFRDPAALRPEMAGVPVFLGLAATPEGTLRMKPQNLLTSLPLASRA